MVVKTFIDRPILSGVISVAIIIVGLIGLSQLPVEQFPDIAPPTVRVTATYTGANAETVMKSVITPLEEQLNGVENSVYDFHGHEYRFGIYQRLFPTGDRSRYVCGERAESGGIGARLASGGGDEIGCHRA